MKNEYILVCTSEELSAVITAISMAHHGTLLQPKNAAEEVVSRRLVSVLDKIIALKCGPTWTCCNTTVLTWPHEANLGSAA